MVKFKLGLLSLATLVVFLCISTQLNAWVEEKGVPTPEEKMLLLEQEPQPPQYAPGEVLVKFKEGVEPQAVLQELDLEADNIERVHSITPAVTKFKKDYKLEKDSDGWYWFRGKNYQEVEEIPDEEMFNQVYQQMSAAEKGLYRSYKIVLPEGINVEEAVAELEKNPDVEYAQPNYIMEAYMIPDDLYYHSSGSWGQSYDDLWGLKKINVETAWDYSLGEGVVVAVIDSGVDYNHQDLAENIWINQDEIPSNGIDDDKNGYIDDVRGWDFSDNDNNPMDTDGHGSHCAGTIAAVGNNSIGVIGVAPKAKIMPVKIFPNAYSNVCASAIKYAADKGADILSNSWGPILPISSNPNVEEAVDYAHDIWGCVVVFAAGNSSLDVAGFSPANYPKTIAVAATTQNDKKCSFSNYGSLIDVAAPGGGYDNELGHGRTDIYNILSTMPDGSSKAQSRPELKISDGYWRLAGTSMACPHVAGLAAVIKSMYPEYSPYEIRGRILAGADNISTLNPGFEEFLGAGRINVYNSLTVEPRPLPKIIKIERNNFVAGEDGNIVIHVKNVWQEAYLIGAILATDNQWVTVQNDSVGFYNVQQGETRTNSDNPFVVSISPDCPFGEEIDFNLTLISVGTSFARIYEDKFHFTANVTFFKDVGEQTGLPLTSNFFSVFVAMEDYNGDDYSDVYLLGQLGGNLYKNRQDGTFIKADIAAGTASTHVVRFIDVDNDGDKDIFVGGYAGSRLYLNNGDGTFEDISEASGVSAARCYYAIAFDYNNDGFVDIGIAGEYSETGLYLLRNNNGYTFTKVVEEAGLPKVGFVDNFESRMVSLDYDNDGDQDFLVSDITIGNYIVGIESKGIKLYRNEEGIFADATAESGIDTSLQGAYDVAAGDYNNDGYIDIFLTGIHQEGKLPNALYRNDGGTFTDVTIQAGDIAEEQAAFGGLGGTDFFDYDNDGDLDLHLTDFDSPAPTHTIYRNNGNGTFTNVRGNAIPTGIFPSNASAAIGDYNNDGALDIYAPGSLNSRGSFLENLIGRENNWIKIKLEDRRNNNALGYGARVYVKTGNLRQLRQVHTGSVETLPLHFGLGQVTKIDEIEVYWSTTGKITRIYNVDANQLISISSINPPTIVSVSPNSSSFKTNTGYTFTAVYSDLDGHADLKKMYLLINTSNSPTGAFYAYYDRVQNKLYLHNGSSFIGGYTPGSSYTIDGPYGKLYCSGTSVSGSGNNLTINWKISFKSNFLGTKNIYLSAYDSYNLGTGWQQKGTITIDNPPTIVSVSPNSSSFKTNTAYTFTAVYSDLDGQVDLKKMYLLVNTSPDITNSFCAYYDRTQNKLYLHNGSSFIGGYAPGSSNIIDGPYGKLYCSGTSVSGSGNNLTIKWRISFKSNFSGTKNIYLSANDKWDIGSGWQQKGTITINNFPTVGTIIPSSGTGAVGVAQTFTTTYSDPDGWQNIHYVRFLMLTSAAYITYTNCVYTYYDQNTNLLYLRNDADTAWLGGFAPGSSNIIENSYGRLNCASTSINGSGTTLTVNWSVVIKPPFTGNKNTYLYVMDDFYAWDGWFQKGTWTINAPPTIVSLSPSSGTFKPNTAYTFKAVYSDLNGWQNIQDVYFLVKIPTSPGTNCVFVYYNQNSNKLYLRNDADTVWLGGYVPGSPNIIENSYGKLNCGSTTISGSGNTLTINWSVTFKSTFTGTKNTYLYVRDDANAYSGWQQKGTITISP